MAESKYYKTKKIALSIVDRERVAVAKEWAEKNKKSVTLWPGYKYVSKFLG